MQLRVLSGLHRGAVLDLDEEVDALTLGSNAEADVPLADPSVSAKHCRLLWRDGEWLIDPLDGAVQDGRRQALSAPARMSRGVPHGLGEVWIVLQSAQDAWIEPPATNPRGEPRAAARPARKTIGAASPPVSTSDGARKGAGGGYPGVNSRLAGGVFAIALVPLAAWFVSAAWGNSAQRAPDNLSTTPMVATSASSAEPAALSNADLAEEFTHDLAERDLSDKLDLALGEERWEIRGSLDAEAQQRFERLLTRFMERRKPDFPVEVALLPLADLLPFKVVEIISGKGATVVTDAGDRLAPGDSAQGYRLASVEPGKAVFVGKRRIEVSL